MFGTRSNPIAAYAQIGVETTIQASDPYQLVLLLFDGAKAAISTAKLCLQQGNIAGKGEAVSKAIDIIANGLKVSLDMEAGGKLAESLAALYDYMVERLLWANVKNNEAALDEVLRLLAEIHSAWIEIDPRRPGAAAA